MICNAKVCVGLYLFKVDDYLEEQIHLQVVLVNPIGIFQVLVPIMIVQSCYGTID